jgi:hypothetical protein
MGGVSSGRPEHSFQFVAHLDSTTQAAQPAQLGQPQGHAVNANHCAERGWRYESGPGNHCDFNFGTRDHDGALDSKAIEDAARAKLAECKWRN